ncbi:MAG TPA: ABC transporter substrate-binding protein, partial [Verrucomicrobiae bacterium]|nr:ABC transporter substrate-binding protein [Verrucomicrobiae bacterium]
MKRRLTRFTMKRKLTAFLMLIGLLALTLTGLGCSSSTETDSKTGKSAEKVTLKIGYLPITHSLPLAVSEKLDGEKFANLKLEPVKFSSWPELTEALNSGQIDGAITMSEIALTTRSKGVPLKFLLFSHREGDNLVVKKEINTVSDLKGKTIGIPHRLSGHNILLYKALKEAGINYNEVNTREIPPPDMMGSLNRGEIDGYIVAEPFGTQAVVGGQGKVLLKSGDIWPDWICCGLVVREDVIQKNSGAVKELVASLVNSGKFIDSNRAEAVKIAAEKLNAKPELWEKSL